MLLSALGAADAQLDPQQMESTFRLLSLADQEAFFSYFGATTVPSLHSLQKDYYKRVLAAADKAEVAKLTQAHLDDLLRYVKNHPQHEDTPDAMLQIVLIYESQDKTVEAQAWRAKLLQEHPKSPAASRAK